MDPITIIMALAQFAPTLIKYITGSDTAATITEKVTDIATQVAGAKTPEEAIQIFQADKEKAWAFKLAVLAADKDLETAFLVDRQNARSRDVEFIKAGLQNKRADILAALAILALIGCIIILFFKQIPEGPGRDILLMLIGALIAIVKDVYSFEFGTSRSSKDKDNTIAYLSRGQ